MDLREPNQRLEQLTAWLVRSDRDAVRWQPIVRRETRYWARARTLGRTLAWLRRHVREATEHATPTKALTRREPAAGLSCEEFLTHVLPSLRRREGVPEAEL